jgi:periplasmic divalent cation tolerance protein
MKMHQPITVTVSYPDQEGARHLARQLLERKLIACAQLHPIESLYHWQNQIENAHEFLLQAKTIHALWNDIVQVVRASHPYQVPEIIATPLLEVDAPYYAWMLQELGISGGAIHV